MCKTTRRGRGAACTEFRCVVAPLRRRPLAFESLVKKGMCAKKSEGICHGCCGSGAFSSDAVTAEVQSRTRKFAISALSRVTKPDVFSR